MTGDQASRRLSGQLVLRSTRIVDLSLSLQNLPGISPIIHYTDHLVSAVQKGQQIGFDPTTLPIPGVHMATEHYEVAIHHGATHVDAPWHYGPTSEGLRAKTIDELPLDWFLARGIVLNCEAFRSLELVPLEFAVEELTRIGLQPRDIVLVHTGAYRRWGQGDYETSGARLSVEAVEWMLDQDVKVIGIDGYSVDRPITAYLDTLRTARQREFMPVHMLGRRREFCIMEKLANLDLLPLTGFHVACFPVRVAKGSGGWCRAVAILADRAATSPDSDPMEYA